MLCDRVCGRAVETFLLVRACEQPVESYVTLKSYMTLPLVCPVCLHGVPRVQNMGMPNQRKPDAETRASANTKFDLIDKNKNGTIEADELLLFLLESGQVRGQRNWAACKTA